MLIDNKVTHLLSMTCQRLVLLLNDNWGIQFAMKKKWVKLSAKETTRINYRHQHFQQYHLGFSIWSFGNPAKNFTTKEWFFHSDLYRIYPYSFSLISHDFSNFLSMFALMSNNCFKLSPTPVLAKTNQIGALKIFLHWHMLPLKTKIFALALFPLNQDWKKGNEVKKLSNLQK